MSMYKNIRK